MCSGHGGVNPNRAFRPVCTVTCSFHNLNVWTTATSVWNFDMVSLKKHAIYSSKSHDYTRAFFISNQWYLLPSTSGRGRECLCQRGVSIGIPDTYWGNLLRDGDPEAIELSVIWLHDATQKRVVSHLSPSFEILCHIFSFTEGFLSRTRWPESWTNFSQVSQHWRSSALNVPGLWTNIPPNYLRWAQEMLKRSKKATLTIRSGVSTETSKPKAIETVRSCLYEINRVKEIELIAILGFT